MKAQILRIVAIIVVLIAGTITSVRAQSSKLGTVNIPFEFIVGQKTLPAGEYTVEPNRRDSENVWLIQSSAGHVSALFSTMSVRRSEAQENAKFVFHKYGEQYFLSEIWEAGGSAGRALTKSKRERSLEREREEIAMARETVTLAGR